MSGDAQPPKSSIYTRTGDTGESSLYTGERRAKDDATFGALGDVDELNSLPQLGLAREHCAQVPVHELDGHLTEVQSRLLDLGSAIATPLRSGDDSKVARAAFPQASVAQLEAWLDALDARLPALRNFILPGGGLAAASLHAARAVARRAERAVVPLVRAKQVDAVVVIYLNRLSDYLFVAARTAALAAGAPEVIYRKAG